MDAKRICYTLSCVIEFRRDAMFYTDEEISEIVAKWTGIPVTRLLEGEREKLLRVEQIIH